MLMTNEEIVADFRRRYEGTFVHAVAENKGIKVLAHLVKVAADSERLAILSLNTQEYGTITTNLGSEEYQIRFDYPQAGVFQYGTDAMLFARKAERQYTRGFCNANA